MANTTNFGWETPDDTDLVKDGAAAIRTLGSSIDTSFVDLKGGTTGQVLAKASNTDLDFTWSAADPLSILDAKADLITATAADTPARLAVGTDGQVLTADSTTSTGLKWATAASGGMTLLATTTLSGASTDVSSIPSGYNYLYLLVVEPTTGSAMNTRFRLNASSATNYFIQYTATSSTSITNITSDSQFYTSASGNADAATSVSVIKIENYSSANSSKPVEVITTLLNGTTPRVEKLFCGWFDDTAVTSIRFFPSSGSFSGGIVYTYGVK